MTPDPPSCYWIAYPQFDPTRGGVFAYRLFIEIDRAKRIRLNVSADERFELYVDGQWNGDGPHRGDPDHWCYHTFEIELQPGRHVIVAKSWWIGPVIWAPFAQLSVTHGFVAWCDENPQAFNTGQANWQCTAVDGCEWLPSGVAWGSGAKLRLDGRRYPWDIESGRDDLVWVEPVRVAVATDRIFHKTGELHGRWTLTPTPLPEMMRRRTDPLVVRHIGQIGPRSVELQPFLAQNRLTPEEAGWKAMLEQGRPLIIESHTRRRVLLDAQDYYCAYPELIVSRGLDARIQVRWAESLFLDAEPKSVWPFGKRKGHRDETEGKYFRGVGDEFISDGAAKARTYRTLWWEAGRYIELQIETADEALSIHGFHLLETRYPLNVEGTFESSDLRLHDVQRLGIRSLQMCSHETHMDCPYYEQLQYVGDTRLQSLTAFAISRDSRLQRRAIELFDYSRLPSGLTQSRYPSRSPQVIPPFSLLWIGMVHDYWMWRGDDEFIRHCLGGVRSVLDAHLRHINQDGLLEALPGWNFVDWVPNWKSGVPPGAASGQSSVVAMMAVLAFMQAADLEGALGLGELATLYSKNAERLFQATVDQFWSPTRNMISDDIQHTNFSEHAQSLALLTGLTNASQSNLLLDGLLDKAGLSQATVYFSHYLFEAFAAHGRTDAILKRFDLWNTMVGLGLRTTIETPDPARSDCHAWGAHPVYHFHASILGIRPAEPGFASVSIRPKLGSLTRASGRTAHPLGLISFEAKRRDSRCKAKVEFPEGLSGILIDGDTVYPLSSGNNVIEGLTL